MENCFAMLPQVENHINTLHQRDSLVGFHLAFPLSLSIAVSRLLARTAVSEGSESQSFLLLFIAPGICPYHLLVGRTPCF